MNRLLLISLLLAPITLFAQSSLDSIVEIRATQYPPQLDGILNDQTWIGVASFPFVEWRPDWSASDSLTRVFITFDKTYLYVGLDARDRNPSGIISRNLKRDGYYGDDFFTFHLDPNLSRVNTFIFSIFPSGSRYDAWVSNDNVPLGNSTFNRSYDVIWEGKTHLNQDGWQAEYRIPISSLRLQKRDGKVLAGISAQRTINHENKVLIFPQVPQNVTGAKEKPSLKQAAIFKDLEPRKEVQISPYILASTNQRNRLDAEQAGYLHSQTNQLNAGLDLRYSLGPNLRLDLTLNTDFSQVEIDDQVINLDRFSIFFPERRKFFQEYAGLFDFNLGIFSQLFYSRSIGIRDGQLTPILGGARLTGQIKDWELGALSLQTEGIKIGEEQVSSENYTVLRVRKKAFNQRSFLGAMLTNRFNQDATNTAFGLDAMVDIGKEHYFIGSIAGTYETDQTQSGVFEGLPNSRIALFVERRQQDGWIYRGGYEYSGEHFNPGMGFLLREKHQNLYLSLANGKFFNEQGQSNFQYRRWMLVNSDLYTTPDLQKVQTWYNRTQWTGRTFAGDELAVYGQLQYEYLADPLVFSERISIPQGHYFFPYAGISFRNGDRWAIKVPFNFDYGRFFDGTRLAFGVSPIWNVNEHLTLDLSWKANRLQFKERQLEEWIYTVQGKVEWALNLHLSGSLVGQYNSLTNQVFTSARFRYNFSDGHDIYLVYNQDYNTQRFEVLPVLPKFNTQLWTLKYIYTFLK